MVLARIALSLGSLAFIGHGLLCLFVPETLTSEAGLILSSPSAITEIRSEYGGLPIALGILFAYSAVRLWSPGLVMLVVVCLGYASVRSISLFLQPELDIYNLQAVFFEVTLGSLGIVAMIRARGYDASAS